MKTTVRLIACLALAGLAPGSAATADAAAGPDVAALVRGNTAFALDLYAQLARGDGNLFCSPYSISTALAMAYGGANGDTATEIAEALHFTPGAGTHPAFRELAAAINAILDKGEVEIRVVNSMWPDASYPFLASYVELLKAHYGVSVTPVDFASAFEAARVRINDWVDDRTAGKIKDLLPEGSLDELTRLVLVNAIYFKGDWAHPFDPENTVDADFTTGKGRTVKARMMFQKDHFGHARIEGAQLLELPYDGDDLSMVVLLPDDKDGLPALEAKLGPEALAGWIGALRKQEVHVHLPRFKMTWGSTDLRQALTALGIHAAFNSRKSDLSGIDGTRLLYITGVFHKAFIEVNEEGTEAAAATGVVIGLRSVAQPTVFRADHPFLFLIREKSTGSILFLGRVADPG